MKTNSYKKTDSHRPIGLPFAPRGLDHQTDQVHIDLENAWG